MFCYVGVYRRVFFKTEILQTSGERNYFKLYYTILTDGNSEPYDRNE